MSNLTLKKNSSFTENIELDCILHTDKIDNEPVIEFDNQTWIQVKTVAQARLCTYKKSKKTCYKRFTSVPKHHYTDLPETSTSDTSTLLRSKVAHPGTSTSGVFKMRCIFCNKAQKKNKGQKENLGCCETLVAEQNIKDAALLLDDQPMLTKISSGNFVAKEVKYHHSCRKAYINFAERVKQSGEKSDSEPYQKLWKAHSKAFQNIAQYVARNIVENKAADLLSSIHKSYMVVLSNEGIADSNYRPYNYTW